MNIIKHLIAGEIVDGSIGDSAIYNPSTAEKIATVLHGGVQEADQAIAAAKAAFADWSETGL